MNIFIRITLDQIMLFIHCISRALLLSLLIFFTSVSGAQSILTEPVIENLQQFTDDFIQKNTALRVKNSQSLFEKSVRKPKKGLLPESMFKSLGYRLRDPFIALPPELSTHLYQLEGDENLYFEALHDLEKIWALLRSTHARATGADTWVNELVNENVVLDAVDSWYRTAHKNQYIIWLRELKIALVKEDEILAYNKEEFSEEAYGQANIQVLELLADNALLRQYLDTESAYLFLRTDSRDLPENAINKTQYDFNQKVFCHPDSTQMQIGNIYLKANFPEIVVALKSNTVGNKVWQLTEVSRVLSKKLLASPTNKQLQAANYVLSDTVLRMVSELNQKRLNKFSQNVDNFFIDMKAKHVFTGELQNIEEYIELQNEIFNLILKDIFISNERISSANLIIFRSCRNNADSQSDVMKVVQLVESNHFKGLDFPQSITIKKDVLTLKQRWNGKRLISNSSLLVQQDMNRKADVLGIVEQSIKANDLKFVEPINVKKLDSIIGATSEQAAQWLLDEGWELSSYEYMQKLTQESGYSVQVITTSSPSEAASTAKRYAVNDEVKVYLSSVTIDNVVEKRYKVLVTFFTGKINAEESKELLEKAIETKGFFKLYSTIREDLIR